MIELPKSIYNARFNNEKYNLTKPFYTYNSAIIWCLEKVKTYSADTNLIEVYNHLAKEDEYGDKKEDLRVWIEEVRIEV